MYFLLHCINWEKSKDLIRSTYIDIRLKKNPSGMAIYPLPYNCSYTIYREIFASVPPPLFALVVSGQI